MIRTTVPCLDAFRYNFFHRSMLKWNSLPVCIRMYQYVPAVRADFYFKGQTDQVPLGCPYSLARLDHQPSRMILRNVFFVGYNSVRPITCLLVFLIFLFSVVTEL